MFKKKLLGQNGQALMEYVLVLSLVSAVLYVVLNVNIDGELGSETALTFIQKQLENRLQLISFLFSIPI